MKFHEDVIFKNDGQQYGQEFIEILNIKGKIIEIHQTEYSILDPKMYKPDLVFELEDKIIILEFQSTYVDINDKKRFRFYTALFDYLKNSTHKNIELHVLSTMEVEKTKCYKINPESRFPIYVHSLKNYDSNKFLNIIKIKIKNKVVLSKKELLLLTLLCFMDSDESINQNILNSAETITDIPNLNVDMEQFAKGVILMLCDKFVDDELLNIKISNLVGGNMKIVEDYAQRVAKEAVKKEKEKFESELESKDENLVINLSKEGYSVKDIARIADVSISFVNQTLSK
ncbi:hypothetical protein [uncultured Methanobrevibacter sp.]|uniref:hypothetical protein n=1 Tax=uncultured Methanobrevibacter sp. TaxID=253161 RepID=UPI0025D09FC1|nr:hypothetical protein [uncultured Methanobrevibacter sp.]